MSVQAATRNTCFALISAIEEDLRRLVAIFADGHKIQDLLPRETREVAAKRRQKDLQSEPDEAASSDLDLLEYCDFGDLATILASKIAPHAPAEAKWLRGLAADLGALAPARNRVCHSRPLEPDDLVRLLDFGNSLTKSEHRVAFLNCITTLERLSKDPTFALGIPIPSFWSQDASTVHNNLPLPEFDETGFLGRQADRQNVNRLIRSHYPVVTIVGEGGVGKTALALRCLYDILDDPQRPFEAIVWGSLKGSALTPGGVRELSQAIGTTLGLVSSLSESLGIPSSAEASFEAKLDELIAYLGEFRVLLAIDNLETIGPSQLRPLLERLPSSSKILITSRVGIGEFEVRYALGPLDPNAASILLRSTARALGVKELASAEEGYVRNICSRLFHNPLLIKWFVAGVGRGATPAALLDKHGQKFEEALAFCFENLFDRMGASELALIETLACARRPLSVAELIYLSGQPERMQTELALSLLHNSSVVTRTTGQGNTLMYQLSDTALAYISNVRPPSKKAYSAVQDRLRELRMMVERELVSRARHPYDIYSPVVGPSKDQRISALFLRRALDALQLADLETARTAVSEAKQLAPDNPEAWRISGLIESSDNDLYRALEELDHAIGLNPTSALTRYTAALSILKHDGDYEAALDHIRIAIGQDPTDPSLLGAQGMLLMRVGKYPEAADLYEKLIRALATRGRKWRVTTRDQAAECYRRWAENDLFNRDHQSFAQHVLRALTILEEGYQLNDFDTQAEKRVARVLDEVFGPGAATLDEPTLCKILEALERMKAHNPRSVVPCERLANISNIQRYFPQHSERIGTLFGSRTALPTLVAPPTVATPVDFRRTGWIVSLPQGAKYGFLEETGSSRRWFFHCSYVEPKSDWSRLSIGMGVGFSIGHNFSGECAVDVTILRSDK